MGVKSEAATKRKVVVMDLRTHRMRTVEGEQEFYGQRLDADGEITPESLMRAIHPADVDAYATIVERCETLKPGEKLRYTVRAKHAEGYWVRADCAAHATHWDERGFAVVVRCVVKMTPLSP